MQVQCTLRHLMSISPLSPSDCFSTQADWKFAAMVLDRMCLILFSLFTATATVTTLAVAPHVLVW